MEYFDLCGTRVSRLGFGMMRLPTDGGGNIDEDLVGRMVEAALSAGVNYFDTAYPYHGGMSEVVAGKVLSRRPRGSYLLATKYPGHQHAASYDPASVFEEQLEKCKVSRFDFYLLHNVCESSIGVYEDSRWGIVDYFVRQVRAGRIGHLGFSSHGELPLLRRFLDRFGDRMEFCQIQLNWLDWTLQQAREKYEFFKGRRLPVWVMEPLRGGRLARLSHEETARLEALRPGKSVASWAMEWLRRLDGVKVILSGMSSMEQMEDNLATFNGGTPLDDMEVAELSEIARGMHAMIPCTGCRYCCDGCPAGLDIPGLIGSLNDARFSASSFTIGMKMDSLGRDKLPSACIGCGACERACPQGIHIPGLMKELAGMLDKLPDWRKICRERAEAAERLRKAR